MNRNPNGSIGCTDGVATLAGAYAKHLTNKYGKMQVYLIHGDGFHAGFVESDNKCKSVEQEIEELEIVQFIKGHS